MRTAFAVLTLIVLGPVAACRAGEPGAADPPPRVARPPLAAPPPGAAPVAPVAPAAPDMHALLAEYAADSDSVRDFYTIGRSPTRLQREDVLDAAWRARLDALDFEALDTAGRIDWLLLRNELRHADRRRAATRAKLEETAPLLPFAAEITALEEARWHLAPVDPEAAATQLDALAKAIKAVKERVDKGKAPKDDAAKAPATPADAASTPAAPSETTSPDAASGGSAAAPSTPPAGPPLATTPVTARRAAGEIDALKHALATWFGHYDQFSPGFAWWTQKPYDAVNTALDEYGKLLREDIAGLKGKDEDPLLGDPIGRDALLDDLAAEMIDYTPEELLAIAEREFAWCEVQMRLAAAELALGEDWKAALAQVKANHVAPGEQDRLVTEQAREAIAFLDAHDLVTVPDLCRETWRVRMIDADTQRTLPYAAYGGQDVLVAYPTRDMDLDTKLMTMRGNNEHFSRIVVPHELIPGHHLQGYAAARSATERDRLGTPFLVEGWALYWEMRLWELGWARSPADRIGMLFWRMHRAARIIISLKFQLGQMQPQEMIDFLVDRVGHEKAGATSEVRRYISGGYGPLYQCAYMVGGLQLRALHDELVGGTGGRGADGNPSAGPGRTNPATGARWTEREFHDAVLAQNAIPVVLIRAALLTGDDAPPLTRSGAPRWRFAGEP